MDYFLIQDAYTAAAEEAVRKGGGEEESRIAEQRDFATCMVTSAMSAYMMGWR